VSLGQFDGYTLWLASLVGDLNWAVGLFPWGREPYVLKLLPSPASVADNPVTCPLCIREPRTHCYHEDEVCWVVDCSSCGTPMIVWKAHTDQLTPAENQHVCQVLLDLFGHFEVDGIRRTHPEHWHAHLRGEEGAVCNPVDPKIASQLSRGEVEMLDRLEAEMLAAGAAAEAAYEAGDFALAEQEDVRYAELQEQLEAVSAEVLESGTPQVGGSETQEGFGRDVTMFLAKSWAEYLRYQRTGWAMGGLDLSDRSKLAEYLRLNLRYDLKPSVTDPQLLEAAEDAYETLSPYFERGKATAEREDRILAKLGDLKAQRRVRRAEEWAHRQGRVVLPAMGSNPGGLQRRTARTRQGVLFETGTPVTFRAMRNTEPSVYMGARFGQDLEPAGTFMLVDDYDSWKDPRAQVGGWVFFEQTFRSPLVIAMVADDDPMAPVYGPTGWKRRLSEAFGGATGMELTKAILAAGHDGIVTVGPARNDVREVVDLTSLPRSAAMRAKKNDPGLQDGLEALRPALAEAAQKIVDAWEQDEEGLDLELGAGGVCDQVAQAMIDVIYEHLEGVEATCGAPEGEDHEWVVVTDGKEAFVVDIHPTVYETGAGYSWQKILGAEIRADDVAIDALDMDLVGELFDA